MAIGVEASRLQIIAKYSQDTVGRKVVRSCHNTRERDYGHWRGSKMFVRKYETEPGGRQGEG